MQIYLYITYVIYIGKISAAASKTAATAKSWSAKKIFNLKFKKLHKVMVRRVVVVISRNFVLYA